MRSQTQYGASMQMPATSPDATVDIEIAGHVLYFPRDWFTTVNLPSTAQALFDTKLDEPGVHVMRRPSSLVLGFLPFPLLGPPARPRLVHAIDPETAISNSASLSTLTP